MVSSVGPCQLSETTSERTNSEDADGGWKKVIRSKPGGKLRWRKDEELVPDKVPRKPRSLSPSRSGPQRRDEREKNVQGERERPEGHGKRQQKRKDGAKQQPRGEGLPGPEREEIPEQPAKLNEEDESLDKGVEGFIDKKTKLDIENKLTIDNERNSMNESMNIVKENNKRIEFYKDVSFSSKSNEERCEMKEKGNGKAGKFVFNMYMNNVRGLQSKIDTVTNILIENSIDVAVISESQCKGNKNLKIPNYVCYFRNRELRDKGGICIYVHEKLANGVMKLEQGLEHNEYFILKFENCEPNLIIICYYGVIEGQFNNDQIFAMQSDIFNVYKKYIEEGCDVLWCGDYNNHLPNTNGIKGNPDKPSPGGVNLMKFVEEENLEIVNGRDLSHTHIDRSDGVSRILDLVVTNAGKKVSDFEVDKNMSFTPYRLIKEKGGHYKRFSDHLGVKWKFTTNKNSEKTNKRVTWNYDRKNGNFKYEEYTNKEADRLEEEIRNSDDVEYLYELILKIVEEGKKVAYGKKTQTKSQQKRSSDSIIWKKRTREVEKAILGLGKKKVNDRIWEMRNVTSDKYSDRQFVGVKIPGSNEMTSNRDETFETTIEYNFGLLRKDDLEEESNEDRAVREAKEYAIKVAMESVGFEEDEELDFNDYERVIKKIKANNKNVYRDFIASGGKFKIAIFNFYQKCYKLEKMPECFYETELLRLYKGKGNRLELQKNRFIHLKPWGPKVYEKLLMTKMEEKLFNNTPECQVGGQKLGSTNEHLAAMITSMRRVELTRSKGAIIFMDIKACFDRVRLHDILFEAVQSGVVGRPLKNMFEYTNNLTIHMQGDDKAERVRKINNSTGQGTGFAPVGTSMVMPKTLEVKTDERNEKDREDMIGEVDGVKMYREFFVDDLSKNNITLREILLNCEVITDTLGELRLTAHPEKSGLLVYGELREEFKKEIEGDHPMVQGFKLGFMEQETYLGMIFSEMGATDSISRTLEVRKRKCLAKAADIKRKLEDERMMGVGWLAGAILIHSSVIMSTLTYGAAALTGMTPSQWDMCESIQRQCLIHILGISNKTTHQSLLYVLGLMPASDVIKKLQICFVNNLIHIKGKGQCLDTILKDYEAGGIKGLIGEVKDYCEDYGLGDVTKNYIHPKVIKETIERKVLDRQWLLDLKSKKPPLSIRRENRGGKFYSTLPKNKAKLMVCYETGELNFRRSRRQEALKKYGSYECLVPFCREDDSLEHVQKCPGYTARVKDGAGPYEFIEYLTELELERNKRFNRSLINFKTL